MFAMARKSFNGICLYVIAIIITELTAQGVQQLIRFWELQNQKKKISNGMPKVNP